MKNDAAFLMQVTLKLAADHNIIDTICGKNNLKIDIQIPKLFKNLSNAKVR